jgi:hypothetical protein
VVLVISFAADYRIARWLILRDTGRKLPTRTPLIASEGCTRTFRLRSVPLDGECGTTSTLVRMPAETASQGPEGHGDTHMARRFDAELAALFDENLVVDHAPETCPTPGRPTRNAPTSC